MKGGGEILPTCVHCHVAKSVRGVTWDGHGMTATQSHAMRFDDMPAMQSAWPSQERVDYQEPPRPGGMLFTPGILGIVETAIETARSQLERTHRSMCVYEHVEWSKVEMEGWFIQQAYAGVLRDIEAGRNASHSGLLCKAAVAELAESALIRIAKIVGDSTYSRHSPYGFWLEDVWALGFLQPPWGLTYNRIFQESWSLGN